MIVSLLSPRDQKRVRGNELFQRKDYERAVHSYQKGLKLIENYVEEVKKCVTYIACYRQCE